MGNTPTVPGVVSMVSIDLTSIPENLGGQTSDGENCRIFSAHFLVNGPLPPSEKTEHYNINLNNEKIIINFLNRLFRNQYTLDGDLVLEISINNITYLHSFTEPSYFYKDAKEVGTFFQITNRTGRAIVLNGIEHPKNFETIFVKKEYSLDINAIPLPPRASKESTGGCQIL